MWLNSREEAAAKRKKQCWNPVHEVQQLFSACKLMQDLELAMQGVGQSISYRIEYVMYQISYWV